MNINGWVEDHWNYDNAVTYVAGDKFPETVSKGDIYIYGDYEYRYGASYSDFLCEWTNGNSANGWGVRARENKAEYGAILESINESNVVDMTATFVHCSLLTVSPKIPNTVEYMDCTFEDTGIVRAPEIPQGVISMAGTFRGCTSLIEAPKMPEGVTNISELFNGCTSLTTAPKIPSSVTNMIYTFKGCTALTGNIEINTNNITNNQGRGCLSGTTKPIFLTGTANNEVKGLLSKTSSNNNVTY